MLDSVKRMSGYSMGNQILFISGCKAVYIIAHKDN